MFEDDVGEVELLELLDSDLGNELRITVLLRIGRVETLFVLYVDHRARPPDFTDKIAAGIGAVRWNSANLRIGLPICVRRHADRDDRVALGEIKRELSELGRLDRWNAVLRQKVVDYLGVLDADEKSEHAQHSGRHAKIEPDTIGVSGPRAGTGSDDHFVTGQILDDLLDQWEHCGSPAVDEALATNLDDVCVRQELDDGLRVEQAHLIFVSRACAH